MISTKPLGEGGIGKDKLSELLTLLTREIKTLFGDKLQRIVLYGSYARCEENKESDLDVMIFVKIPSDDLRKYRERVVDLEVELSLKYDLLVSIILQAVDEYNKWLPVLPFFRNVQEEGVEVFG